MPIVHLATYTQERSNAPYGPRVPRPQGTAQFLEVLGQGTCKAEFFPCRRMQKAKRCRVQGLPEQRLEACLGGLRQPRLFALESCAIYGIAQKGMTYMRQMDADLMGASR